MLFKGAMKFATKKLLATIGILRYLRIVKRYLRILRTTWLRNRFPNGGFSNCNGAKVFVNYYDDNYAWYDGNSDYLKHEIAAFKTLFKYRAPRNIIDIGAHWGFYPAILEYENTIKPLGIESVVCIEPDSKNILNLKKTVSQISAFKVVIVEKAISDSDCEVPLYVGDDQTCPHLHRTESDISIGLVMSKTLPSILEEIGMSDHEITHIKVDIDGFEPALF